MGLPSESMDCKASLLKRGIETKKVLFDVAEIEVILGLNCLRLIIDLTERVFRRLYSNIFT